jgi:hypothetical protein
MCEEMCKEMCEEISKKMGKKMGKDKREPVIYRIRSFKQNVKDSVK